MTQLAEHIGSHGQAAAAALAAGKRRRELAKSIAATSSCSGTPASSVSGTGSESKRGHDDLQPTPSTRVTPDAKAPCARGDDVPPRSLDFEGLPPMFRPMLCSTYLHSLIGYIHISYV